MRAAFLSDLTATFARVFLANAHDIYTTIAFVHAVTGPSALRPLMPYLRDKTVHARSPTRGKLRPRCTQLSARAQTYRAIDEAKVGSKDELIDRAIACGDEHAIKFTEVCLREHALKPDPAFLAAAGITRFEMLSAT